MMLEQSLVLLIAFVAPVRADADAVRGPSERRRERLEDAAADVSALLERLGVELPVVQAGMGGGLSRHELAAAVSEAGGLGTIGFDAAARICARELAAARRADGAARRRQPPAAVRARRALARGARRRTRS